MATTPPNRLPAGRHGLPREFVVHNQRTRILDAMGHLVAQHGYEGTSVAAIVEDAGVSRKTFYEHFTDKQDCFLAAYDTVSAILIERVAEPYFAQTGLPWEERLRGSLETLLDVLSREPDFARMCIVEVVNSGAQGLNRFRATIDRFRILFDEGRELTPEGIHVPAAVSQGLIGGIATILYRRIMNEGPESLPELLPEIAYLALSPYVGRERAQAVAMSGAE